MTFEFETEIKLSEYYVSEYLGLKSKLDTYTDKAKLKWTAEPEIRTWGVKSFYPIAKSITASFEWEIYIEDLVDGDYEKIVGLGDKKIDIVEFVINENNEEKLAGDILINIPMVSKWEIIEEFGCTKSGDLSPEDCEIDFRKKTITIS